MRVASSLARSLLLLTTIAACATVEANASTCFETGCVHGSCQIVGHSAQCICFPRWTGQTCDACATGYVDRDGDGVCTRGCSPGFCTNPNEVCVETPEPSCTCAEGYARQPSSGICAETPGPRDPGFETTTTWSVRGDVQVAPGPLAAAWGFTGSGFARFFGDGEVYQTFTMPPFPETGPLAVSVSLRCAQGCTSILPRMSLTLDGQPLTIPFFGPSENTFCLGERAFGRDVTLGLRSHANANGAPGDDAYIDRVQFVQSPGCPAPRTVVNGDFESDEYPLPGRIEQDGNHKVLLEARCESLGTTPPLSTTVSIGLTQNALAFSVDVKAVPQGTRLVASLDGVGIGATDPSERGVICLPPWSRGWVHTVKLEAKVPCTSAGSGSLLIDDLVLTKHRNCDDAPLSNGGFEQSGSTAWIHSEGRVVSIGTVDPAHSGRAYFQLVNGDCRPPSTLTTSFTVPDRIPGAGGPSVKLWFRNDSPDGLAYVFTDTLVAQSSPLPLTSGWAPKTLCLHPGSWGHRGSFGVSLHDPTTTCKHTSTISIDDVSVGPDPSCPE